MNNGVLSRDDYHKILWWKIIDKQNCPFCWKNLDYSTMIWEWKYWRIFYNKFPYTGNSMHIMALPKEHKKFFYEITAEEFSEMTEVHKKVKEFFWEQDYFSFTRETFWEETRSVEHLHMHFLAWILKWKYIRKMLEKQWFPIKQDLNIDN